jgi:hypothetical protein
MNRPLYREIAEQLVSAYKRMAREARYRPAAPSDGFGHITMPLAELDLDAEALAYAQSWWRDEERQEFYIGCCNGSTRSATVFAIEAARQMCGGSDGDATALRLLELAVRELRQQRDDKPVQAP